MERDTRELVRLILPVSGVAILLLFMLLGLFLIRSITVPVRAITVAARRLADGDDEAVIPAQGNNDEMGDLARILATFRSNFGETQSLRDDLETAKSEVERSAQELKRAQDLAAMAQPGNAGSVPLGAAPGSSDDLSGKPTSERISAISQQVAQSSQIVSAAAFEAERTGALIKGLTDASEKIDAVEDLLDAIAGQLPPGDDPVSARFNGVRETADEATLAMRDLGDSVNRVKRLAMEIADSSSSQALETTADLLQRSEDLRGMLDDLVSRIRTSTSDSSSS